MFAPNSDSCITFRLSHEDLSVTLPRTNLCPSLKYASISVSHLLSVILTPTLAKSLSELLQLESIVAVNVE